MRRNAIVGYLTGNALALLLATAAGGAAVAGSLAPQSAGVQNVPSAVEATASAIKLAQATMPDSGSNSAATPPAPPAEPQVSDKVREILASAAKGDRIISRKGERQTVEAFYQKRNFQPLWVDQGKPTGRADEVLNYIKSIDADGLEPSDYSFPKFSATSLEGQAETELKFTAMVLNYARHALNGRVHWSRISPSIFYKDNYDAAAVLEKLGEAGDMKTALDSFNPQQPAYLALKAKLGELRGQSGEASPRLAYGAYLKYGSDKPNGKDSKAAKGKEKDKKSQGSEDVAMMQDPRVPLLREKLGLPAKSDTYYDKELAEAVAQFQGSHGLKPDGQVGNPTIDALNGPSRDGQIAIVLANMERWRWVPRDLGKTHVVLNIPDFHLRVYNEGKMVWMTRVVVGKPTQATPLLSETMKFITVNPVWNVPQSIVYNELLPIYETSNPNIFAQQGLRVEQGRDGIRVFQPPGDRNALGRLRFNFPNKFLVYQHDTPEKNLFAQDRRAFSHGCMRVQDPVKYAEVMLSFAVPGEKYTQDRIRKLYSDNEFNIDFKVQIPVHITYQTAFVDDEGKLQFREDIYGLDSKLIAQTKGAERRVADVMIERPADPNYKPSPTDFARLENVPREGGNGPWGGRGGRGGGGDPFAFFGRLFR